MFSLSALFVYVTFILCDEMDVLMGERGIFKYGSEFSKKTAFSLLAISDDC